MNLYATDPLADPRWSSFVLRHKGASVFHTQGWLRTLRQTYGYEPVVMSTCRPDGEQRNGILFCRVGSPFAGARLVSLPFSDHCQPLCSNGEITDLLSLLTRNETHLSQYTEIRPVNWQPEMQVLTGFCPSQHYYLHVIDLRPELPAIFGRMHKDCIQRKIRRADREGVEYREGNSMSLVQDFFPLFVATRRRHGVPPQPWPWFVNLCACMGNVLKIRMAYKDCRPIAGMITISHRTTMVYKYGCSDRSAANLGATSMLFWRAIQDAKRQGMLEFDLGRSDLDASGLIAFKEHLGGIRQVLTYATFPKSTPHTWPLRLTRSLFRHLPNPVLAGAGRLLYRYIA